MANPESRVHDTIKRVVDRRVNKPRSKDIPSSVEGIQLHVEQGTTPHLTKKATRHLGALASRWIRLTDQQQKLDLMKRDHHKQIEEIARSHDGLRGIRDEVRRFALSFFPVRSISWDYERLDEALEIASPLVLAKRGQVTVDIPLGAPIGEKHLDRDLLRQAMVRGLVSLGFSEGEVDKHVHAEVGYSVNEETLSTLLGYGELILPEDVATISESWRISEAS
jgi:hypothetical protein